MFSWFYKSAQATEANSESDSTQMDTLLEHTSVDTNTTPSNAIKRVRLLKKKHDNELVSSSKLKELEKVLQETRLEMERIKSIYQPTFLYYDGSMYQGEISDESQFPNGYGILVYSCGVRYAGQWKEGRYHGKGTLYVYGGPAFHAEWEDGMPHGEGWYEGYEKHTYVHGVVTHS